MKEGYKVLKTIGGGLYIQVTNYVGLNEIGHYRYYGEDGAIDSPSVIGMWKPKLIKQQ